MSEQTPARVERRRSRRHRPKPTTEVACRSETRIVGPDMAVSVLDISAEGIRLIVNAPLDKGEKIEVDLEGIGYCRPLRLSAEIIWSLATADGNWCIGAKF
jgi:PilZ domain